MSTLLFFLIPIAILGYLYISMAISLKGTIRKCSLSAGAMGEGSVHGDRHLSSSRRQIIRMLGEESSQESDTVQTFLLVIAMHQRTNAELRKKLSRKSRAH
jgi:hypothetical protein